MYFSVNRYLFFAPRFYSKKRELEMLFKTKVLEYLLYFPRMHAM